MAEWTTTKPSFVHEVNTPRGIGPAVSSFWPPFPHPTIPRSMGFMTSPSTLGPARGLNVLHLFCHPERDLEAGAVRKAVDDATQSGLQIVTAAIVGAKADTCFLALGQNLWDLRRFQSKIQLAGFHVAESYVSLTEVSEYAAGMPEEMLQARLYPTLPPAGMSAFCFYPMSKRRGEMHNWYQLDYDAREGLMRGHGAIGRTFQGRVPHRSRGRQGLDDCGSGA